MLFGAGAGILGAVLLSLSPLIAVGVIVAMAGIAGIATVRRDARSGAFSGGFLVGAALVLVYGDLTTAFSCTKTASCVDAGLLPFVAATVLTILAGAAAIAMAFRHGAADRA